MENNFKDKNNNLNTLKNNMNLYKMNDLLSKQIFETMKLKYIPSLTKLINS